MNDRPLPRATFMFCNREIWWIKDDKARKGWRRLDCRPSDWIWEKMHPCD